MEDRRSQCPIVFALDIFGDRWTSLLVRDIGIYGKQYFGQFEGAEEGIATNVLTDRLRSLQEIGVLDSRPDPEDGRRVLYEPTEKGLGLIPLLVEMLAWGGRYDPKSKVPAKVLREIERDRDAFVAKIERKHRERLEAARESE